MEHYNRLSPVELEKLSMLMEECGEVIQIIGKIQRHGYESRHPDGGPSNRELLHNELTDVFSVVEMMFRDVGLVEATEESIAKRLRYAHHITREDCLAI